MSREILSKRQIVELVNQNCSEEGSRVKHLYQIDELMLAKALKDKGVGPGLGWDIYSDIDRRVNNARKKKEDRELEKIPKEERFLNAVVESNSPKYQPIQAPIRSMQIPVLTSEYMNGVNKDETERLVIIMRHEAGVKNAENSITMEELMLIEFFRGMEGGDTIHDEQDLSMLFRKYRDVLMPIKGENYFDYKKSLFQWFDGNKQGPSSDSLELRVEKIEKLFGDGVVGINKIDNIRFLVEEISKPGWIKVLKRLPTTVTKTRERYVNVFRNFFSSLTLKEENG